MVRPAAARPTPPTVADDEFSVLQAGDSLRRTRLIVFAISVNSVILKFTRGSRRVFLCRKLFLVGCIYLMSNTRRFFV
jgi:hypothetical protein